MDSKGFFLGLLAAVVLFLLWKKESAGGMNFSFAGLVPSAPAPDAGGGCAGCNSPGGCAGCAGASGYAAPAAQASLADQLSGFVTPGTPPLQTSVGSGSFYAQSGPTSDTSFTNFPAKPVSTLVTVAGPPQRTVGSPTTRSNQVPPRAVAQMPPSYTGVSFHQNQNVAGVPRKLISTQATNAGIARLPLNKQLLIAQGGRVM